MIISVVHDPESRRLTITLPNKIVQLVYTNLPPNWESNPQLYLDFIKNYLNNLIEQRTDASIWHRDRNIKQNDPEYYNWFQSERMWIDTNTDEVVFMEAVVTEVVWDENRQEFLIRLTNTSPDVAKV